MNTLSSISFQDSGTAVRKRVIRIMREICERFPSYDKVCRVWKVFHFTRIALRFPICCPSWLEELSTKMESRSWFKKLSPFYGSIQYLRRLQHYCLRRYFHFLIDIIDMIIQVIQMTSVAQVCAAENTSDFLEQLLQAILKQADKVCTYFYPLQLSKHNLLIYQCYPFSLWFLPVDK